MILAILFFFLNFRPHTIFRSTGSEKILRLGLNLPMITCQKRDPVLGRRGAKIPVVQIYAWKK